MASFDDIPNEVIHQITSYLDIIPFWEFTSTCQRLTGFRTLTNDEWRKKYAVHYHLNEKELAFYNRNWPETYRNRFINEASFIKEIQEARERKIRFQQDQILKSVRTITNPDDTCNILDGGDEESGDNDVEEESDLRYLVFNALSSEFDDDSYSSFMKSTIYEKDGKQLYKLSCNPFYTLLTSNNYEEVGYAVNTIFYGLSVGESKHSYRMIDVLVTTLSKHLKSHPNLLQYIYPSDFGNYIYAKSRLSPTNLIGSISLLAENLNFYSPILVHVLCALRVIPRNEERHSVWEVLNIRRSVNDILHTLLAEYKEMLGIQEQARVTFDRIFVCILLCMLILLSVPQPPEEELKQIFFEMADGKDGTLPKVNLDIQQCNLRCLTSFFFFDCKGDLDDIKRLIRIAIKWDYCASLPALIRYTNRSALDEALQMVSRKKKLIKIIISSASENLPLWDESLTLMLNIFKTDIGKELLWEYKRMHDLHNAFIQHQSRIAGQESLYFNVLTNYIGIALSKCSKHKSSEFLQKQTQEEVALDNSNLISLITQNDRLARNRFWLSYLKLEFVIDGWPFLELASVLVDDLKQRKKILSTAPLLAMAIKQSKRGAATDVSKVRKLLQELYEILQGYLALDSECSLPEKCEILRVLESFVSIDYQFDGDEKLFKLLLEHHKRANQFETSIVSFLLQIKLQSKDGWTHPQADRAVEHIMASKRSKISTMLLKHSEWHNMLLFISFVAWVITLIAVGIYNGSNVDGR